jgi:uncharacterized protein YndB with AHSA1/START domain
MALDRRLRQLQAGVMDTPAGFTKDAGWEAGVQRTVKAPIDIVWRYLTVDGARTWLGVSRVPTEVGGTYETLDGTTGELLSITATRQILLTWHPKRWLHGSTLQVTLAEAASGTTISIHQERLANGGERSEMLRYWAHVMTRVESDLTPLP